MKQVKRIVGIFFAVLLVFGLAAAIPQQTFAAATKTVYVMTQSTTTNNIYSSTTTAKYSYNSDGLLKAAGTTKYTYSSKNLITKETNGSAVDNYSYKSGKLTKSVNSYGEKTVYKYNSSGQLKTVKRQYGSEMQTTYTYNKNGQVSSITSETTNPDSSYFSTKYSGIKYDSQGIITGYKTSLLNEEYRYKITYKNNRLVKKVEQKKQNGKWITVSTTTYKYKKLQVSSSLAKKINAQQKCILNPSTLSAGIVAATAGA